MLMEESERTEKTPTTEASSSLSEPGVEQQGKMVVEMGGGGGGGEAQQQPLTQQLLGAPAATNGNEKRVSSSNVRIEEEEEAATGEGRVDRQMETETPSVPAGGPQVGVIRGPDLFGYVGIEAVLDQMRRKTMKAGFEFNIMVVGESHAAPAGFSLSLIQTRTATWRYSEQTTSTYIGR